MGIPWLCGECSGTSLFRGHKKPVLLDIYGLSSARAGARCAICKLERKKNPGGFAVLFLTWSQGSSLGEVFILSKSAELNFVQCLVIPQPGRAWLLCPHDPVIHRKWTLDIPAGLHKRENKLGVKAEPAAGSTAAPGLLGWLSRAGIAPSLLRTASGSFLASQGLGLGRAHTSCA